MVVGWLYLRDRALVTTTRLPFYFSSAKSFLGNSWGGGGGGGVISVVLKYSLAAINTDTCVIMTIYR